MQAVGREGENHGQRTLATCLPLLTRICRYMLREIVHDFERLAQSTRKETRQGSHILSHTFHCVIITCICTLPLTKAATLNRESLSPVPEIGACGHTEAHPSLSSARCYRSAGLDGGRPGFTGRRVGARYGGARTVTAASAPSRLVTVTTGGGQSVTIVATNVQ